MPGCIMAMARVNRPAVMVYGGTIRAGCRTGMDEKLDIISAFQAYAHGSPDGIPTHGTLYTLTRFEHPS